jgi:hypothetical protein
MRSRKGARYPGGEGSDKPPEQCEIVVLLPPTGGEFSRLLPVEQFPFLVESIVHGAEDGDNFGPVEELPAGKVEQA